MKIHQEIFLGKKSEDLSRLIETQSATLFKVLDIDVPVKSSSIIVGLLEFEKLSVIEIADKLKQSRQLIIQKLPKLKKMDLVKQIADPEDRRRKIYVLTEKGIDQAMRITKLQKQLVDIYHELYSEINLNLFQGLEQAINSLQAVDLLHRYQEQFK